MKLSLAKCITLLSIALTCASQASAYDSSMQVDESLLSNALPLNLQPPTRTIRRYELLPQEVDRRFTCYNPSASLKIQVEIAHTNDVSHTATLQLINPVGAVEASFLTTASRLARYPDVNLDSYKIRFGEELSTLVINAHRMARTTERQMVSGLLQSDNRVEIVACTDELIDPNSLKALEASFYENLKEVSIAPDKLPKSMCAITAIGAMKAKFICSAVLIAPNLALTANHCLAKMKDQNTQLSCGDSVARINLKESASNPVHDKEQWRVANDIAVIKLDSEITVSPASLVTTAGEGGDLLFTQTESCGAFGFGNQFDGRGGLLHGVKFAPPPEDLGGLTLTIENYQNEKLITSDPRYFLRPGDSGGGVICNRGDEEVVVGIHSFSYPIDSTVNSASVGHNYQWLLEQINKMNGVTLNSPAPLPSSDAEVDPSQDPNLIDQSAPINSEII